MLDSVVITYTYIFFFAIVYCINTMQYNYSTIPFISNTEHTYIRTLIAAHDWDDGKGGTPKRINNIAYHNIQSAHYYDE